MDSAMVLLRSMTLSFGQRWSLSPSGTVFVTTTWERQLLLIVSTAGPYGVLELAPGFNGRLAERILDAVYQGGRCSR